MIFVRKKTYVVLAVILCVALAVCALRFTVSAATPDMPSYAIDEINAYINEHMEEINACSNEHGEDYYAYMILDEAEESLKPIILEARWRIISNTSWVDDELNGHIEDEAGNIIEIVPHFHEIFPADWEIEVGRGLY